jgi:hypothetical protein
MDNFGKGRGPVKFDEGLVTRAELQISQRFRQAVGMTSILTTRCSPVKRWTPTIHA